MKSTTSVKLSVICTLITVSSSTTTSSSSNNNNDNSNSSFVTSLNFNGTTLSSHN